MRRLAALVLVLALALAACGKSKDNSPTIDTSDSPAPAGPPGPSDSTTVASANAKGRTIEVPWAAPTAHVANLIDDAGLPALPSEVLKYHIHAHLDVFVDGKAATVPANLGIDQVARVISPL